MVVQPPQPAAVGLWGIRPTPLPLGRAGISVVGHGFQVLGWSAPHLGCIPLQGCELQRQVDQSAGTSWGWESEEGAGRRASLRKQGSMEATSSCWELTRLPEGLHGLAQPLDPSSLAMSLAAIFHLSLKVLPLEEEGAYPCIGWRRHRQTGLP